MFDSLVETGRRISAKERDQRSTDQPSGERARLVATHWLLSPAVDVEIENAADLFTNGLCAACSMPLGARNEQPMRVRYKDPIGRSCDGVQAHDAGALRGERAQLYSERFRDLLSDAEQTQVFWRPVEVTNRKKTKRELFELLGSAVNVRTVPLRGGYQDRFECTECHFQSAPAYGMVGSLPDWLNPNGDVSYRGQPSSFISSEQLPIPVPTIFTLGGSRGGPACVVSDARPWPKVATPGAMGVSRYPLGVILPELVERADSRHAAG